MFDPKTPNVTLKEKEVIINSRHIAELLDKSHKVVFNAIKSLVTEDGSLAYHFNPATYSITGGVVRVTSFDVTSEGFEYLTDNWVPRSWRMEQAVRKCLSAFDEVVHYEVNEASTPYF